MIKKNGMVADNLFPMFLLVVVSMFLWFGYYVKSCLPVVCLKDMSVQKILRTEFVLNEPKEKKLPEIKSIKQEPQKVDPVIKNTEPIDLSEKPVTGQVQEDTKRNDENKPVVRRVYGLQKVYSTGLGSGGDLSDAVIGKIGNTLNTPVDTFTATKQEIVGKLVSTTTVTTVPKFVKMVKPEYNKEMLENKTEGVVRVKALIDIDGRVKKATILSDIGFHSGEQAVKATLEMEFSPAMCGTLPVAVWIVIPIKFVMIS